MLCRDCKHWLVTNQKLKDLENYPRDIHPNDGWIICPCDKLKVFSGLYIEFWGDGEVNYIETDANFGCVLFKQK
jgi:hypothetical protein